MVQKSFYEETEPKKVLKGYLRAQDTLYDKYKVISVKKLLDGVDLNNLKVLEVGCGGGFWTKFFVESGAKVTAVDIQRNLIEAAEYYLCKEELERNCEFVCGNATKIKLSKKYHIPYRFSIGKSYEHRFRLFHCLEVFGDYFPLDRTGYSIGVICIKR